jgi:hypothetical protein
MTIILTVSDSAVNLLGDQVLGMNLLDLVLGRRSRALPFGI